MWKAIKQRNLQEKVAAKDLVCYINAWWINRDGISCIINGNNYPINQNLPKINLVVTDIFINNGYLSKAYLFYPTPFHGIICRCIIPTGTKYYINENQEIISETLYILESLGEIQAPRKKLSKTKFEDLLSKDVRINIDSVEDLKYFQEALFSKDWKWGEFVFDQKLRLNPKTKGINLYSKNKQFLSSETDWLDTFDSNVIDFEDIIFWGFLY